MVVLLGRLTEALQLAFDVSHKRLGAEAVGVQVTLGRWPLRQQWPD
jgi:hypothetical protein